LLLGCLLGRGLQYQEHKEHQEHQEHQECKERREDGLKQDEDEANSHQEEVPSTERILVLGVESSDLNSLFILLLLLQHHSRVFLRAEFDASLQSCNWN
jgi:hypothetical protein